MAIKISPKCTMKESAHGCARRNAIGRRRTRIESLETDKGGLVGRMGNNKATSAGHYAMRLLLFKVY